MAKKKLQHINRRLTDDERARDARIREAAMRDFPPKPGSGRKRSPPGIPSRIRQAREARGLTWYALAKQAGVPNQATIRDIEQGKDVKLSNVQAVAAALGLELELVEIEAQDLSVQLTPNQKKAARQAKQCGEQRIYMQLTPEQKKDYREAVAAEMAGKDANIAHCQKFKAASEQPGFLGDIRRAILLSRPSIPDLATAIGVDWSVLSDFQAGEAELPAPALDRLLEALGLRLMQDIPR